MTETVGLAEAATAEVDGSAAAPIPKASAIVTAPAAIRKAFIISSPFHCMDTSVIYRYIKHKNGVESSIKQKGIRSYGHLGQAQQDPRRSTFAAYYRWSPANISLSIDVVNQSEVIIEGDII